jgi:hypothetical protein
LTFFTCLGFRSERDNFRIRSPFEEVNIWPESGRRDGRNGIGFVDSEHFHFLAFFSPVRLLDLILDHDLKSVLSNLHSDFNFIKTFSDNACEYISGKKLNNEEK